ncbi:Crp/Fnr family transcriptional regulator [Variovorax sp. VNK109]|jgi:CRP/FNR family cyclic AMP-dependent transcriptional regulator|uniref:Crp/Fnr family transcriptional regulator n=1 Tax=Variovorax sp. VNK109 TaxID=3400919 RepID=UPI003C0ADF28
MTLLPFLQDLPAFERFSESELDAFVASSRLYEFPEGHRFSSETEPGESTYLVVTGRVRVFHHDQLLKTTLSATEVCSGEMFNLLSLMDGLSISTTAVALEPSIALEFSREGYALLKKSVPRVAHQIQYMIAIQLANALQARNAALRERL